MNESKVFVSKKEGGIKMKKPKKPHFSIVELNNLALHVNSKKMLILSFWKTLFLDTICLSVKSRVSWSIQKIEFWLKNQNLGWKTFSHYLNTNGKIFGSSNIQGNIN